jgi:hypothetical protein
MKTYQQRPKTSAGRIAWDAFKVAMGAEPKEISYGHGTEYGWCWTSEDARGRIWVYTASWAKAHCSYSPPVAGSLDSHRGGDEIDCVHNREMALRYGRT